MSEAREIATNTLVHYLTHGGTFGAAFEAAEGIEQLLAAAAEVGAPAAGRIESVEQACKELAEARLKHDEQIQQLRRVVVLFARYAGIRVSDADGVAIASVIRELEERLDR